MNDQECAGCSWWRSGQRRGQSWPQHPWMEALHTRVRGCLDGLRRLSCPPKPRCAFPAWKTAYWRLLLYSGKMWLFCKTLRFLHERPKGLLLKHCLLWLAGDKHSKLLRKLPTHKHQWNAVWKPCVGKGPCYLHCTRRANGSSLWHLWSHLRKMRSKVKTSF